MTTKDLFEYTPQTGLQLRNPGGGVRLREVEPAGASHRQGGGRVVREDDDTRTVQDFARAISDGAGPRPGTVSEDDGPSPAAIFAKTIS